MITTGHKLPLFLYLTPPKIGSTFILAHPPTHKTPAVDSLQGGTRALDSEPFAPILVSVHHTTAMFKVYAQKGFQTTFPNGFTVSVMFGAGNYCEHRLNDEVEPTPGAAVRVWSKHDSVDAEIAVIGPDGEFRTGFPGCPEFDQVRGWVTPSEMLEVMNWAASQTV